MKQVFLSTTEFKETGIWLSRALGSISASTQSESMETPLPWYWPPCTTDAEEMSRINIEDEYTLIIVDVPITEEEIIKLYCDHIPRGLSSQSDTHYLLRNLSHSRCLYQSETGISIPSCVRALSFKLHCNAEIYLTSSRSIERGQEQEKPNFTSLLEMKNWLNSWSWKDHRLLQGLLKTNERVIKNWLGAI